MLGRAIATLSLALTLLVGAGCSNPEVVPDGLMTLGVANGTSIPVTIVVNDLEIEVIPPLALEREIPATDLPPLPWQVEARTSTGRTLLTLLVRSGDVRVRANGSGGVGERVDLSCGRLDVWSGPPMVGPMPGPGVPGDCD